MLSLTSVSEASSQCATQNNFFPFLNVYAHYGTLIRYRVPQRRVFCLTLSKIR